MILTYLFFLRDLQENWMGAIGGDNRLDIFVANYLCHNIKSPNFLSIKGSIVDSHLTLFCEEYLSLDEIYHYIHSSDQADLIPAMS
jgi:hypothetical protein